MRRIIYTAVVLATVVLSAGCNKEKKLMKNLEGNWSIEESEIIVYNADGTQETTESMTNAGDLVISEGSSDEEKNYDFFYVNHLQDTMDINGKMFTDEYNTRLFMGDAITDTAGVKRNIAWTIEKEKKNKQVWSVYGVDSVLFYPLSNNNPGAAGNWVRWKITLKRQK